MFQIVQMQFSIRRVFTSVKENWLTFQDATPLLLEIQNLLKRILSLAFVVLDL